MIASAFVVADQHEEHACRLQGQAEKEVRAKSEGQENAIWGELFQAAKNKKIEAPSAPSQEQPTTNSLQPQTNSRG